MDLFQNLFRTPLFGGAMFDTPALRQASSRETAPSVAPEPKEASVPRDADDALKQRRAKNQLQAELQTAIAAENFEWAAELRDEIHRLGREA